MSDSKSPTHRVYTLIPRKDENGDDDKFWLNIGSVWPNADGKGFNIQLDALPIHNMGQLVLREIKEPAPEPPRKSYKK